MKLLDVVREVRRHLEENGRVSLRLLRRQYDLDDEALDELIEELVDVQRVARREENVLVWSAPATPPTAGQASGSARRADQPTARGADARKVVTILFADLAGSTGLHERLDPESVNAFMENYYRAMRGAVEAHRGTVVKFLGDGVMAAFGVPRVAEDDAMRAVGAGMQMQEAFRQLAGEQRARVGDIGLRVAINTGEVVVNADNTDVVGDPVNVAARLQQEARNGDVVLGESTYRLVAALVTLEPLGSVTLKGRAEAVKAYRVESLERPVGTATAAFVGRDDELERMTAVYDAAIATPATRLAVLLGSPGLGKSRMIEEFARRLGRSAEGFGPQAGDAATVLTAQCDVAGGATFAPLAEALRELLQAAGTSPLPAQGVALGSRLAALSGLSPEHSADAPGAGGGAEDLRVALETALPAAEAERTRIVAGITALLAGSPASPEETFFVIRRFLAALAQSKPVVLVIDDLHWAEPLLLDLVEHLVQWGSGVPLLVLVGARPELRDLRSSLVTPGGLVADVLTLSGLDAGAAMRLAANVIGAVDLPAAVAAKVLATSEGNPLFVGELVRMLVQEGGLMKEGDRWIPGVALAALEMPPTIHALLAARIERLRPEERSVLERAAVVGRHFSRNAVAELLPRDVVDLDARLEALRRSELVERDTGWFLGEPVLRFHHILIRDAAYRRLLKGTRAELHARFADWVVARAGAAADHDETIGWHLEQAHQLLRELGPLDTAGRVLGERAAQHLAAAGRRALARDDLPVAANLLGRAVDRLDVDDAARADLALDWCEALLSAGDVGPAAAAIAELGRFIEVPSDTLAVLSPGAVPRADGLPPFQGSGFEESNAERRQPQRGGQPIARGNAPGVGAPPSDDASNRRRAWHTCFKGQLTVLTAPQGLQAAADVVAGAAEELAKLGDAAGEAKAHSVLAQALARLGKVGACEAALDKALAAARRAGDRRRANAVLAGAPLAALWGPSPVTRASGRCLDVVRVLRITQGAPAVESVALSCQGVLEALRGRTEAARRMLASSRKMVEDLGIAHRLFEADAFSGRIVAMEGEAAAAERLLRSAYEGLRELGLGIDAARAGALLARTLLAQDRVAEAESLSHESERLAGDDLQAAIAWRGVRAEALAKRGEHTEAVELARAAVAIASTTDALLDHADARMALAAALRAAGRGAEANAEQRRAIELWEAKGATLLAERVRSDRERAAPTVPAAAPIATPTAVRRRVRPNAATAMQSRFLAALAARDFDAVAAEFHEQHREIDHPTGSTYGRDACIASVQRLFRSRDPHYEAEPIATLGERLLLSRRRTRASGDTRGRYDVGPYENEAMQLFEVDVSGLCRSAEVFAADRLGDALVRLYERYAEMLPDGAERRRAAGIARALAAFDGPVDPDRLRAAYDPSLRTVDHRVFGTWSAGDAEEMLRHFRLQLDLAPDFAARYDDVLAANTNAMVARMTFLGTARDSGGRFENHVGVLFRFGVDGRVTHNEVFEAEQIAAALTRFEELVGCAPDAVADWFENAASRTDRELFERFNVRDWAGVEALAAPDLVFDERRRMLHNTCGRDVWLEQFRVLYDVPASRFTTKLLGTRGERLSLSLHRFAGEVAGGGGPVEMDDHLVLHEVDGEGRLVIIMLFNLEDQGAAWAELDARYDAGEGATLAGGFTSFTQAANGRDWETVAALFSPTWVEHDHRSITGIGTTRGREAWLEKNLRTWIDLAPDFVCRFLHLRRCGRGGLWQLMLEGWREGGRFEIAFAGVTELDERGLFQRHDLYDADRVGDARARFAELARGPEAPERFANAATATVGPVIAYMIAHDWPGFEQLFADSFHMSDRRRVVQLDLEREQYVAFTREIGDGRAIRGRSEIVATRGERLALTRSTFEFTDGDVGPSEVAFLLLTQVDERGRIVAYVRWDLEDLGAAYAELDARWATHGAAEHPHAAQWLASYLDAFTARDWTAMTALFTPDLVGENHRLVGWGTRHGPEGVVSTLQAQIELAPDTRERVDHVRTCGGAVLFEYAWHGTREGGAFENLWLVLVELDDAGRGRRADVWEAEQFERAGARFAQIAAKPNPHSPLPAREGEAEPLLRSLPASGRERSRGPLAALAKPNAAAAFLEHAWAAFDMVDLAAATEALATAGAHFSPDFVWEDRRPIVGLSGGLDLMLASARARLASGARHQHRTIVGTAGDRVAVGRILWAGGPPDGRFEVEFLAVHEVNEAGLCTALIFFDPDDERAAQREAWARWAAIEPVAAPWVVLVNEFIEAWNGHDRARVRACFADDFVLEDHRHAGLGRIEGAEAYVDSIVVLWDLAPDQRIMFGWSWPVVERHGMVVTVRRQGTVPDGGPFETEHLALSLARNGRFTRIEFFEIDALDTTLARFEELRPPSLFERSSTAAE